MKGAWKRMMSLLLAVLLVPAVGQPVQAVDYVGTESYMSGKYYRALEQVELTGDPRTDIVNIALSQVGYQESTYMDELSGEIYGNVNFTEYGDWYDMQDQWCAMFVSWCAALAGISKDVVPRHSYTPNGLYWLKDKWGRAYSRAKVEAGVYTPQPGDLIYFKSASTKAATNHVGIVTGYRDGVVYTVEGNTSSPAIFSSGGTVAHKSYPITNTYIVYICSPDYEQTGVEVKNGIDQRTAEEKKTALKQAVCVLESGAEGRYDSIGQTADGVITMGCAQWYGNEAKNLLQRIYAADPEAFTQLDTVGIAADLDEDWQSNAVDLNSEKAQCLRQILGSEAGIRVQMDKLEELLSDGQTEAARQGVFDEEAQLACAVLRWVGGTAAVRRVLSAAEGDHSVQSICDAMDALGYAGGSLIREALN